MFNKHLPLLHGNVSILPEVRFFLSADAGNCAVQRRIFRNKRVCLPKNSCSWVASSPSQSSLRDASSPKVGALGSPHKLHLFAKASPFEERLPPAGGRCRAATKGGIWHRVAMTERARTLPVCHKFLTSTPFPVCERPAKGWIFSFCRKPPL